MVVFAAQMYFYILLCERLELELADRQWAGIILRIWQLIFRFPWSLSVLIEIEDVVLLGILLIDVLILLIIY